MHQCQCRQDGSLDKLRLLAEMNRWPYTAFEEPRPFVMESLPAVHGLIVERSDGHPSAVVDGVIHDMFDASEGGTALIVGYWVTS